DLSYLKMDYSSMNNLELMNHSTHKDLSLYQFINHTQTNIGARALKEALSRPMINLEDILRRQKQIDYLLQDLENQDILKTHLHNTYDIHRVIARMSTDKNNAQDFVRLKKTLGVFKELKSFLEDQEYFEFIKEIDTLDTLHNTLDEAIHDDAPVQLKEGRTFKEGIDQELDELLSITKDGRQWLMEYEQTQRNKTNIKNLKVGYTRAFGYYIEISKGQVENVKDEYGFIRKQTLTNAERYITEELQNYETKVLEASDRILEIENELIKKYTAHTLNYTKGIQKIGEVIGQLDILYSLTQVSSNPLYVKPTFNDKRELHIVDGRHPVLEKELTSHQYIASDVHFDDAQKLLILTGPNMGGKSTYMRMLALNIILAQMGSYVPAKSAHLPLIDQIFTRMGASDDILMGQSTFMVEMMEAQSALSSATQNSLILFDEIGRGTSTYDGMALAQAILQYVVENIGANTIFSTHYHELTDLEDMIDKVKNIHVAVHEEDDHVTFLYHVINGRADKSYGINVAKLAHLPHSVIERANLNLNTLEAQRHNIDITQETMTIETEPKAYTNIKNRIGGLDINQMTPVEALILLQEIKSMMGDDENE
ncbi:MAG TPA: DNA mismatch repair protein MutS, partial [Erysipelothrix sp.]|nr:DNA mismatch repair protein MutS [Erysipelothrix sp.]